MFPSLFSDMNRIFSIQQIFSLTFGVPLRNLTNVFLKLGPSQLGVMFMKLLWPLTACLVVIGIVNAQAPRPSNARPQPPPQRLNVTPPLTQEEADLRAKIASLAKTAGADSASNQELKSAVRRHFELLTHSSKKRVDDLRKSVAELEALLERREKAKEDLIDAEVKRISNEVKSVHFHPPSATLLRSFPSPRVATDQAESVPER